MIESIFIKKVASFDDLCLQINDLKTINFIYGANASWKITISNLIANPDVSNSQNCSINWKHNNH
jgi:AAA15 family ATPase/GTPase